MSLLESLARFSSPVAKPSNKDPLAGMRIKFAVLADEQIKQIKASAEKGRWFSKQQDDSYVLSLKNGNKALPVGGHTHFQVKDAANAVKFIDTAKKAVQAGELDQVLSETAFKRKPKSSDAVGSNDKGSAGTQDSAKQ